jgi:hypothetical protein
MFPKKGGMPMPGILIKDTTREEREEIIRKSLDCGGGGCENCSSCGLGGGDPYTMYQPYIDGEKEIAEINAEYRARYIKNG